MSRTKEAFEDQGFPNTMELPRGWPKPNREYEDHADMQAAKRLAKRMTPEMLAELQDDELVIVPARMVKRAA